MSVREWYSGREILLTGSTGHLGQNLLDKLLRSLTEDVKVHLLIRPKLALNTDERLYEEIIKSPGFERLRQERPDAPERVLTWAGDLDKDDLGLKPEDADQIRKNVSVVLHAGGPAQNLVKFCRSLTNLKAVVISNDVYRFKVDKDRVPERLIEEKLPAGSPLAFVRLPALGPALREPMPGYVQKLQGPTALMIGTGHVLGCPNYAAEIIPVDLAANTFLVTAWDVGIRGSNLEQPMVYNAPSLGCTWGELVKKGKRASGKFPYPTFRIRGIGTSTSLHWIMIFLCEWLPSFICDTVLFLLCRAPRVCKEHMRVRRILRSFEPKTHEKLTVERRRAPELHARMSPEDQEAFPLTPEIDLESYILCSAATARRFCVDEASMKVVFFFFPTIYAIVLLFCGYYYFFK